jgi:hypothetical protein
VASSMIYATRSATGEQPPHRRLHEKAAQSFQEGVPVMVDPVTGFLIEWDGVTVANGIAGVSKENGSSLTTSGVPKTLTYGSVVNQSSAVKIPMGAPLNDGRCGVDLATPNTVFFAEVGSAQGGGSLTQANVGKQYGMTKDTDGHWYVDTAKAGASAVCTVVALGPGYGPAAGAPSSSIAFDSRAVLISFLASAQQLVSA